MMIGCGGIVLSRNYEPYGTIYGAMGSSNTAYGFTSEWTDSYIKLVYLRSRYYSTETGRFISRDTWQGDYTRPMSYNYWLYVYANPINFTDPNGLFPKIVAGIMIDDNFSEDEEALILETINDYAQLFGGEDIFDRNLALIEITQGWTNNKGLYNATYSDIDQIITLPYGWYSPVIAQAPNGQVMIILGPPCTEDLLDFPTGSLPSDEIGAKFVLAHEMTHAFAEENATAFNSFKDNVSLPWTYFAGFSTNPIISRNAGRSLAQEIFADMMAAYLYSQTLLNQQMMDWVELEMPTT